MKELLANYIEILTVTGTHVEYPKNFILQRANREVNKFWLLKKGIARYFYSYFGKEVTGWFDMENELVGSVSGLTKLGDTNESIQLLEDSDLIEVKIEDLVRQIEDFNKFKADILAVYFLELENRVKFFQNLDGKQRYLKLMEEKPMLLQRVPLDTLASFLGITPESLSRIRSSIS